MSDSDTKPNKTQKDANPERIIQLGFAAIAGIVFVYALHHHAAGISDNPEHWAWFGDYIGGVANPIIALLALAGLIRTLQVQKKEFEETRKEMQKQSRSLEIQVVESINQTKSAQQQAYDSRRQYHVESLVQLMSMIQNDIDAEMVKPFISNHKIHNHNDLKGIAHYYQIQGKENAIQGLNQAALEIIQERINNAYAPFEAAAEVLFDTNKQLNIGDTPTYRYLKQSIRSQIEFMAYWEGKATQGQYAKLLQKLSD